MRRRTLAGEAHFEGRGLHSGVPVEVRVIPWESGIHFRHGTERWQAIPENVTDTSRCTRLGGVSTIEHLMSAFAALQITDAEVELTAPELPGMGGNALGYYQTLSRIGTYDLGEREAAVPFKRVYFHEGPVQIAIGRGAGHWRYTYNAGDRWPGEQSFEATDVLGQYLQEIAPARTFALAEELPMIKQYGLGQGLDESSALVLGDDGYQNAANFPDEPARHKLLDLIGDLYLSGIPISLLNVTSTASGHRTNVEAAKLLRSSIEEGKY